MSEETTASVEMVTHIPVFKVFKETYQVIFRNIGAFMGLMVLPSIYLMVLMLAQVWSIAYMIEFVEGYGPEVSQSKLVAYSSLIVLEIVTIVLSFPLIPYFVTAHKLVQGEQTFSQNLIVYEWWNEEIRYFKAILVFLGFSILSSALLKILPEIGTDSSKTIGSILGVVFSLAILFVQLRLLWVFPARAFGTSYTVTEIWSLSKNNILRFFASGLLIMLPAVILSAIIMTIMVIIAFGAAQNSLSGNAEMAYSFLITVPLAVLTVTMVYLSLIWMSLIFNRLTKV